MVLSGCSALGLGREDAVDPLDPKSMGAEWQAENFAAYYEQDIEWYECGEDEGLDDVYAEELEAAGFDLAQIGCAYIQAPFDWEDPSTDEAIELSVVHIPATSGEPRGTLLGNPGGPGATG